MSGLVVHNRQEAKIHQRVRGRGGRNGGNQGPEIPLLKFSVRNMHNSVILKDLKTCITVGWG